MLPVTTVRRLKMTTITETHEYLDNDPQAYDAKTRRAVITTHLTDILGDIDYFMRQKQIRGLIVNGDKGIGKTHMVEAIISNHKVRVHKLNANITPVELHIALYKYARKPDQVFIIDDTDCMLEDTQMCDTLKAALGGGTTTWSANSANLRIADVPKTYTVKGRVIMITNKHLNMLASTRKEAQRLEPVVDRCEYVYAGLSKQWTLEQIKYMVEEDKIELLKKTDPAVRKQFLQFLESIHDDIKNYSIRMFTKCINAYERDPDNWKRHARRSILQTTY